jgi:hypothetical protein
MLGGVVLGAGSDARLVPSEDDVGSLGAGAVAIGAGTDATAGAGARATVSVFVARAGLLERLAGSMLATFAGGSMDFSVTAALGVSAGILGAGAGVLASAMTVGGASVVAVAVFAGAGSSVIWSSTKAPPSTVTVIAANATPK